MTVPRVSVATARSRVATGDALLVCAYDSDAKFVANQLAGAIPLSEFTTILTTVSKDREIIFYCA
jgi:hypothetical protein